MTADHPTPRRAIRLAALLTALAPAAAPGADPAIVTIAPEVLGKEQRADAAGRVEGDGRRRTDEANARNRQGWAKVTTREAWEKYRDERVDRLRRSLGEFPEPGKPTVRVTGSVIGDGYRIDKLAYES